MTAKGLVETWLKRLVLIVTAALLCVLMLFVWRLAVLVQKLDQSVEALSSDVKNVTDMATEIAGVLFNPGQLVGELAPEEGPSANPVAAGEIGYLMDCIGQTDLRYEYGDDNRSAAWVQAKFWMKYRAFGSDIASAEDFIRKVASETHKNETYYVIEKNGNKIELSVFLTEALKKYRSQDAGKSSSTPATPSGGEAAE